MSFARHPDPTVPVVRSHLFFGSHPRAAALWSTSWRLIMAFLMVATFVIGMWAGMASQAAVAYAMSQQEAQLLHRRPPVSPPPRRASRIHAASMAACPALTGTPTVGGTPDDNGLGTLSFYTLIKHSLSDQVSAAVNVANGNLVVQATDMTIHGTGLDLNITSTYNSQSTASGTLGNGWNLSVGNGVMLTPSGSNYILSGPSGYAATYEANDDSYGGFEEPPGLDATLLKSSINGASHVIVFQHTGECLGFNSAGYEIFDEDHNGNAITFTYNGSNQLTTITDTQGRLTTFTYGGVGRVKTITDPIGRTVSYTYDGNGNLQTMTNMAGKTYTFGYTAGVLTNITDPDTHTTSFSYQSGNMVTSLTDATTAVTSFAYYTNSASQCTSVNDSDLPCTVVTGTPVSTPEKTTYLYNGTEVQYVKDANGNMASTTYTPDAYVNTYTDALQDQTVYNYDTTNAGNLMQAIDGNGATTSFQYTDSDPYLPTKETNPQGNSLTFKYDTHGNLVTVFDSTDDGTGSTVSYTYNTNGTLATSTDGDGNTTSYTYDTFGNLQQVIPPSPLGKITYTVDSVSRISSITDGKGQLTSFTYDNLDHLTKITYNDGSSITYSYDNEGNVTSVADNTGTTTFQYDADNRITLKTLPGGQSIRTAYDHVGNLTTFTDGGGTVTYAYTPVNQVASITEPDGSKTTFSYNSANQRTGETYPNGVNVDLDYDKAGHLTLVKATNSSNQTLIDMQYSYQMSNNAFSNLLQKVSFLDPVYPQNGTDTWTYSYNTMNRLREAALFNSNNQEVDDFLYTYDKAANRTQYQETGTSTNLTYNYNAAEELVSRTNGTKMTTYSYDADGNLTGSSSGPSYTYNPKNQTTAIGTDSYTYSGSDQTERVQVNSTTDEYSGLGLSAKTSSGSTTYYTRCSCGMLIDERLPDGKKYYYLLDAQESVVGVMDTSGNLVNAYVYDPFGNFFEQSEQVFNPWQYASGYLDATTGLYHFGARYYDPTLGRWTQQDPLAPTLTSPDSLNRYLYVNDDPVNATDTGGKLDCAALLGLGIFSALALVYDGIVISGSLAALLLSAAATIGLFTGIGIFFFAVGIFVVAYELADAIATCEGYGQYIPAPPFL